MNNKRIPAKRVDIVSLKLVKESSVLYETRKISKPYDAYRLAKNFLKDRFFNLSFLLENAECVNKNGILWCYI